jgi:hypothetical protein
MECGIGNRAKTGCCEVVEKRSSAVLRCKPHRLTYIYLRLALRFFARLTSEHFLTAPQYRAFQQPHCLLFGFAYLSIKSGMTH